MAYQLWLDSGKTKKLKDIAAELEVSESQIRKWKNQDDWNSNVTYKTKSNVTKRKGAPKGNKNAVGNPGGAAPPKNNNAEKFGFFRKHLPEETVSIIEEMPENPLDILWDQIQIAYAAIIRAQKIMYVDNKNDKTKEIAVDGAESTAYDIQQAWDKQSNFLQAQSRAQKTLEGMINRYEDLLHKNWEQATEEQKMRIEKLKAEAEKLKPQGTEEKVYTGIPATMIIPKFAPVVFSIENNEYLEYVFPGGRGSTKSSFVSLAVIDLIMKNPELHAVVGRQVADTLRTSVYQQMVWAIEALGLSDEFKCGISPLEITRKGTGQKIYFRGADDPGKFKSIKVPFGYIGVLWLEELDQFVGPEAVRKIEQSVIRGGDKAYIFKSFNPPKTASNWANKYVKIPKENRLVTESNYLDVPPAWLGKPFIDEAEFLKLVNPTAYENEYMGVANGTGGMVFDNVTIREITNQEIARMDRIYRGVDWGWYPDPWAYNAVYYYAAEHRLYVIDEDEKRRTKNEETARILKEEHGLKPNDKVVCDSAEEKSTADYKDFGIFARNAIKGPGSVDYSMKWLQSLSEIVIDNRRTPHTAEEFLNYEYDRDKDDQVISGYPDRDSHHIDAIRYAMEEVWRRRGQ